MYILIVAIAFEVTVRNVYIWAYQRKNYTVRKKINLKN